MRNIVITLLLSVVGIQSQQTFQDPCNTNNGLCDRRNGLCFGTGRGNHFCACKAGFKENPAGFFHTCDDVNECAENPCGDNADCENTYGSYRCVCRCGYILDYTGTRCLEAKQITDMCIIPARCVHRTNQFFGTVAFDASNSANYVTDYRVWTFHRQPINTNSLSCKCEDGFAFNTCGYCQDINECYGNPCTGANSQCVNTEGSYYCTCSAGYTLGPCRKRCYGSTETVPTLCEPSNLDSLTNAGLAFRTYMRPILLEDYRNCKQGRRVGDTTVQRFNIDQNPATDIKITWVCSSPSGQLTSTLKNYAEGEARWEPWTCWTACKATCWGGLQTRVRKCINGLPGIGNCNGPASQKRSCYNGRRCPYRVRKDIISLSTTERNDLIQAMRRYKQDLSATGFHNAASAHGWPFQCDRQSCCPHGAKMEFLSWHRTIILNFEEGLSRYLTNKQLGIPYWNWLNTNRDPPALGWQTFINGQVNPFTNMTVLIDQTGPMRTIQRDSTIFRDGLNFAESSWQNIALRKIQPHIMHEFAESVESGHGGPHISVCGNGRTTPKCAISLAQLNFAAFDPLFMFHHSQVDRQWAIAQKKMEAAGNESWTLQTAVELLEPPSNFGRRQMPFGNTTINPFPIVHAVNTMRDSYYYEELTGVRYDDLENDGYPLASRRALRIGGPAALFIAHYFESDTQNFYVNYYNDDGTTPCNRMLQTRRLGGVLRLGTSNQFRLTIPHLTSITDFLFGALDTDINIKTCYTRDSDCRERCPEFSTPRISTMPSPNLVYYIPNSPVDMYKFEWGTGRRMPNWYINIDAKSQWIYFYGDRVNNIRQVSSYSEFVSCNGRSGRFVPCSIRRQNNRNVGGACVLPSGVYFLVDSDTNRCRQGLKLIVVSRIS